MHDHCTNATKIKVQILEQSLPIGDEVMFFCLTTMSFITGFHGQ